MNIPQIFSEFQPLLVYSWKVAFLKYRLLVKDGKELK